MKHLYQHARNTEINFAGCRSSALYSQEYLHQCLFRYRIRPAHNFNLLVWAACLVISPTVIAQDKEKVEQAPPADTARSLFARDSSVAFTLTADLRTLLRDRGEEPVVHAARVTYINNRYQPVNLPLMLKVRGNFPQYWTLRG